MTVAQDEQLTGDSRSFVSSAEDRRSLVSSARESFESEIFTDCILITGESIPVPVHRMIVSTSPFLETLFLSTSCCRGMCSHFTETTIMLPDVSYKMLSIILDFFYNGKIRATIKEMAMVKELLVDMFKVPKSLVMLHKKEGYTDCVECAEHVPESSLLEHLVTCHVEDPCIKDMSKVESGNNRAVSCSQHPGVKECDIDKNVNRINNGNFNYIGEEDPVARVLEHYKIHYNNMVQYVKNEYPHIVIPLNIIFDEKKMRELARNCSSKLLEPDSDNLKQPRTGCTNTVAGITEFPQSVTPPDISRPGLHLPPPPPSRTHPINESGVSNSFITGSPGKDLHHTSSKPGIKRKLKSMLSSSSSSSDSEDSFSDPPGGGDISEQGNGITNNMVGNYTNAGTIKDKPSADVTEKNLNSMRKLFDDKDDTSNSSNTGGAPPIKKARTTNHDQILCRVCKKTQVEYQFAKHVTTHLYELWPEIERTDETKNCKTEKCDKQFKNWKHYIQHLATHHGELSKKLAAKDQSLSDYEMDADVPENEEILLRNSKKEALLRYGKPEDYFEQEQETSITDNQGILNISGNPLLDNSQEDAMVIVENVEEDVDVDELLNDSQEDPDIQKEPAVSTSPTKVDSSSGIIISPIVIDTTSQSDSDVATKQIQETIRKNQALTAPGPQPEDENNDSDTSDGTMPWSPTEKSNERLKEVEEE